MKIKHKGTYRPRLVTIISVRTAENCLQRALLWRTAKKGLSGWLKGDTLSLMGYFVSGEAGGDDGSLLGELSDISGELTSAFSFDMGVEIAVSDIVIWKGTYTYIRLWWWWMRWSFIPSRTKIFNAKNSTLHACCTESIRNPLFFPRAPYMHTYALFANRR